jgi:hypothetical protein
VCGGCGRRERRDQVRLGLHLDPFRACSQVDADSAATRSFVSTEKTEVGRLSRHKR